MIERIIVGDREATICFFNDAWEPVEQSRASFAKVIYDDGEVEFVNLGETDPAKKTA